MCTEGGRVLDSTPLNVILLDLKELPQDNHQVRCFDCILSVKHTRCAVAALQPVCTVWPQQGRLQKQPWGRVKLASLADLRVG